MTDLTATTVHVQPYTCFNCYNESIQTKVTPRNILFCQIQPSEVEKEPFPYTAMQRFFERVYLHGSWQAQKMFQNKLVEGLSKFVSQFLSFKWTSDSCNKLDSYHNLEHNQSQRLEHLQIISLLMEDHILYVYCLLN